jgi:hypothetical protein
MSDQSNRVAAEPADPSGKPDKKVPTDGVGGVIEDTNEQASKPDANVDVGGQGFNRTRRLQRRGNQARRKGQSSDRWS